MDVETPIRFLTCASVTCASKWHERWTVEGEQGCPIAPAAQRLHRNQTPVEIEDRVEALRRSHKLGPVQLMGLLASEGIELATSTIYRVLVRRGISGCVTWMWVAAICASRSTATSGPDRET